MSNFTFLKDEWASVYNSAAKSERLVYTDPRTACFHARRALELAVDWIYEYDDELRAPYDNNLSSKIFADDFRDNLPRNVFVKVDYIRRIGNEAVHSQPRKNCFIFFIGWREAIRRERRRSLTG
ncbi:hypothetical protein BH24ACI1_BH24ACI1_18010 [soil metagenome]